MTYDEGIQFLRAHQPMPVVSTPEDDGQGENSWEYLIEKWLEVIDYFIENPCEEAIPLLLNSLGELDDCYASITCFMKSFSADVAIPYLIEALQSPSHVIRTWAADLALDVDSGRADFIEALIAALEDPDSEVRGFAVRALEMKAEDGYLDWRKYESQLKSLYKKETDKGVKKDYEELFEL